MEKTGRGLFWSFVMLISLFFGYHLFDWYQRDFHVCGGVPNNNDCGVQMHAVKIKGE